MLKIMGIVLPLIMAATTVSASPAQPEDDRAAIDTLLDTYQTAVSKKDQTDVTPVSSSTWT